MLQIILLLRGCHRSDAPMGVRDSSYSFPYPFAWTASFVEAIDRVAHTALGVKLAQTLPLFAALGRACSAARDQTAPLNYKREMHVKPQQQGFPFFRGCI